MTATCPEGARWDGTRCVLPMPEGDGLARQLRMCQRGCEFFTTDYNRGLVRQCAAGGCAEMQRCDTAQGAAP